ncbi:MAG TPA: hypothetical protein VKV21_18630 [Solirubrobacteraceae bacterium]|nr:hypothetical protein [Solirubrobacteraceae bacterium]
MVDSAAAWGPGDSGIEPVKDAGTDGEAVGPKVWLCHIECPRTPIRRSIIRIHPARGVVESTV